MKVLVKLLLVLFIAAALPCAGFAAAPTITTASLPNGVATKAYTTTTLTATGGTSPYTWSFPGGISPIPALTLDPNGTLSGTPTTAGTYNNFSITVTDSS